MAITTPVRANEHCKVCDSALRPFGTGRVLDRHEVRYYRCETCGFVQTEPPHWLNEAYETALIAADVGAAQRNIELAALTQAVIQQFFRADGRFLDYGGGYGLFVRLMRDRGFDFRWHDRYAPNLLSRGFEAAAGSDGFELVTAFEVLEHLVDPVTELAEMLRRGDSVLCTTHILPATAPRPGEWWYYALSGGQHVSLFTLPALRRLAARFDRRLISDGVSVHLITSQRMAEWRFRLVVRSRVRAILNRLRRRRSLLPSDFQALTGTPLD
jgi:2-polyprenyl-3-methyl-5-hydroxy-6-metoxy-1,4-benzoquinol methylase